MGRARRVSVPAATPRVALEPPAPRTARTLGDGAAALATRPRAAAGDVKRVQPTPRHPDEPRNNRHGKEAVIVAAQAQPHPEAHRHVSPVYLRAHGRERGSARAKVGSSVLPGATEKMQKQGQAAVRLAAA